MLQNWLWKSRNLALIKTISTGILSRENKEDSVKYELCMLWQDPVPVLEMKSCIGLLSRKITFSPNREKMSKLMRNDTDEEENRDTAPTVEKRGT